MLGLHGGSFWAREHRHSAVAILGGRHIGQRCDPARGRRMESADMSRPTVADRYWGERIERERQAERDRRAAWMDWWRQHAAPCRACGAFQVVDYGGGPIIVQVAPLPPSARSRGTCGRTK